MLTNYSPPLYQLSYREWAGWGLEMNGPFPAHLSGQERWVFNLQSKKIHIAHMLLTRNRFYSLASDGSLV